MSFLVVGAGLSGASISRQLAEAGLNVTVIDKRSHVAGNAYDFVNSKGERIHKFGPHLLHGSKDSQAIKWLSRFTDWVPYEHRVRALLPSGNQTTPLPVNVSTLEDVFDVKFSSHAEACEFLESLQVKRAINSADDVFVSSVGEKLADLFFRPYTKKMWGIPATEIEAAVGKRLPVRSNRDDRYFTDSFQALPANGYTKCVQNILNHENITLCLSTEFNKSMISSYQHAFLCVPIDEYFDFQFGKLPYRSIKFEERSQRVNLEAPVINFTDPCKYTRMTQWDMLPNSKIAENLEHTITYEIPCNPEDNDGEIYYPVRNKKSLAIYSKYAELASDISRTVTFCGRTGLFEYLDMIPAISKHLMIASSFISCLISQSSSAQQD